MVARALRAYRPAFSRVVPLNSQHNKKPKACIGVGLRHSHYTEVLSSKQNIDFVEVHAENFFAKGGASCSLIDEIADAYPLSLHGTSLGLGSSLAVPKNVLQQFSDLVKRTNPMLISEHLCFNRAEVNGKVLHSGDLLPIPYNSNSLNTIVEHIQQVQESIQRPLLIENLSAYILPSQLVPQSKDEMSEFEFLISMCEKAGCGLLLDLNNLIINELNRNNHDQSQAQSQEQKAQNPLDVIQRHISTLPAAIVGEIHLAGFTDQTPELTKNTAKVGATQLPFIIDDHGAPVSAQCWELYQFAVNKFPNTPTLVEWDTRVPEWPVLLNEANKARDIAEQVSSGSAKRANADGAF